MKLSLSLLLCGILIYGLSVVAADDTENSSASTSDSDEESDQCIVQYLKSKGKLDVDVPVGKKSSMCVFGMQLTIQILRGMLENKVQKYLPEHLDCFMAEYDKLNIIDDIFYMGYVKNNKEIAEEEKTAKLATIEKNTMDLVYSIQTKCGIDKEKFEEFRAKEMQTFDDSSEEVTTTA